MKVIVPTNSIPNSILIQDIVPQEGIIIVNRNNIPYGFIIYSVGYGLFFLQTNTMDATGQGSPTLAGLLENIQKRVDGDISLDYYKTHE